MVILLAESRKLSKLAELPLYPFHALFRRCGFKETDKASLKRTEHKESTDMESRKSESNKKKLWTQLLLVGFVMMAGMTIYEALKQMVFPNITIWQSHAVTIAFSTTCALVVSFFLLRRHLELNRALAGKILENERLQQELKKTIEELETTLSKIKTLKGLLPICASCKKIRDDKGYWNQIESYVREHSEADFSHGICPECMKKLYPEESVE